MFVTLQATDTVVHSYTFLNGEEHALVADGDSDWFMYLTRNLCREGERYWKLWWKGEYDHTRRTYVSNVEDMIVEQSGFYGNYENLKPVPVTSQEAMKVIDKMRNTSI